MAFVHWRPALPAPGRSAIRLAAADGIADAGNRAFAVDQPLATDADHFQRLLRRVAEGVGGVNLAEIGKGTIRAIHAHLHILDFDTDLGTRRDAAATQLGPILARQAAVRRKARRTEAGVGGIITCRPGSRPGLDAAFDIGLRPDGNRG